MIYVIVAFAAFVVIGALAYQIRLSFHRGVSREAFIEEFQKSNIPREISAAVYDYYKSAAVSKKFSVSPDDSYEKVFREVHEDIDDDAEQLVTELGMELPIEPVLREWDKPLETLRDMVFWLDWVRQHQWSDRWPTSPEATQEPTD